jgi:hypothetical protein
MIAKFEELEKAIRSRDVESGKKEAARLAQKGDRGPACPFT